ncbi:MAG: hypothetical protein BGO07_00420 [Alphaproteobacteria bacterium 40-19]|nr:MAG: hypothetical protein BGO07_00420 [Alphaproteobacteria bacterium 40-19]
MTGPAFLNALSFFKTGLIRSPSNGSGLWSPYVNRQEPEYQYMSALLEDRDFFYRHRDYTRLAFVCDALQTSIPPIDKKSVLG